MYDHSGLYSNDFTHLISQNTQQTSENSEIHVIWRVRLIFSTTAMSDIFAQSCWTLTNFLPGIEKVSDSLDFAWIDQQLNIHGRVAITVLVGKFNLFLKFWSIFVSYFWFESNRDVPRAAWGFQTLVGSFLVPTNLQEWPYPSVDAPGNEFRSFSTLKSQDAEQSNRISM